MATFSAANTSDLFFKLIHYHSHEDGSNDDGSGNDKGGILLDSNNVDGGALLWQWRWRWWSSSWQWRWRWCDSSLGKACSCSWLAWITAYRRTLHSVREGRARISQRWGYGTHSSRGCKLHSVNFVVSLIFLKFQGHFQLDRHRRKDISVCKIV